jgi:signal peptidase II
VRDVQAARGAPLSPDAAVGTGTRPRRRIGLLAAVAVPVLVLDQATKLLVVAQVEGQEPVRLLGGQLIVQVTRNPGAAFSFGTGLTPVFTAVAVFVIAVILWTARRLRSAGWAVALGLLLGGAAGNLVDRLFRSPGPGRGAVVDFLDFQVWPSFNVADSAIVVGGLLAVLLSLRGHDIDGRPQERPTPGEAA